MAWALCAERWRLPSPELVGATRIDVGTTWVDVGTTWINAGGGQRNFAGRCGQ